MKKCKESLSGKHTFKEEEIGQYDFEGGWSEGAIHKITRTYAPVCIFCSVTDDTKMVIKEYLSTWTNKNYIDD